MMEHRFAVRHANSLDLFRLVAASAVIVGHSWPILGYPDPPLFGGSVNGLGVFAFFAISGYLIAKSWSADRNLRRFWTKRALRILPALAVVVLFVGLIAGPMLSSLPAKAYFASGQTWAYVGLNLMLWTVHELPGVFTALPYPHSVNTSLWTLPIEVTMYAVTLVMVPALVRFPKVVAPLILTLAVSGVWVYLRHPWSLRPISDMQLYGFRLYDGLTYIPCYLIGTLFAFTGADRMGHRRKVAVVSACILALLFAQFVADRSYGLLISFIPFSVLTLVLGLSGRFRLAILTRIGDVSYGTYLWGFFIQQMIVWTVDAAITPLALAAVSLPIAWLLGAVSWHLVEKPALRWKPRTNTQLLPQQIEVAFGADADDTPVLAAKAA